MRSRVVLLFAALFGLLSIVPLATARAQEAESSEEEKPAVGMSPADGMLSDPDFREFLDSTGDVADPYPDGHDQATLLRYQDTAGEIKAVIESGPNRLIRTLQASAD